MISDADIRKQLSQVLELTNFEGLGERYVGKVRDNYSKGKRRILITTDRLSCFDRVVTTVPFKGQVLNTLAEFWFRKTENILRNHVIEVPDCNVVVAQHAEVFPVEVVVRTYVTGSAWRDYVAGKSISGVTLPKGLRANEKLSTPIITPSTKAAKGAHDMPIPEQEIIDQKLVAPSLWEEARAKALELFALGSREVAARGLILVDTKYEFGIINGALTLVDELHTLDSSRFWKAATYEERFERGEPPEMLDKEPTRQWLLDQGFKGDGDIPDFTDEHRIRIAKHYIEAFELISGLQFEGVVGDPLPRIERALEKWKE